MGRGQHTDVHAPGTWFSPTRRHLVLLHDAQEPCLHSQSQVSDLVEQQRARAARLEQAWPILRGAPLAPATRLETADAPRAAIRQISAGEARERPADWLRRQVEVRKVKGSLQGLGDPLAVRVAERLKIARAAIHGRRRRTAAAHTANRRPRTTGRAPIRTAPSLARLLPQGRTVMTGQAAARTTCWAVEPKSAVSSAPLWVPMTMRSQARFSARRRIST